MRVAFFSNRPLCEEIINKNIDKAGVFLMSLRDGQIEMLVEQSVEQTTPMNHLHQNGV